MKNRKQTFDEREEQQHSAQIIPFPAQAVNKKPENMQVWRVVRVICPPRKKS